MPKIDSRSPMFAQLDEANRLAPRLKGHYRQSPQIGALFLLRGSPADDAPKRENEWRICEGCFGKFFGAKDFCTPECTKRWFHSGGKNPNLN